MKKELFNIHTHTDSSNFKLRDSTNKVEDVLDYALELGMQGIAITDHSTISSHIRASKHIKNNIDKFKDFKLAFGDEFYLVDRDTVEKGTENNDKIFFHHFLALAKNKRGYEFIKKLTTNEWENSFFYKGMQRTPTYYDELPEMIKGYEDDVIFSTACFTKGQQVETKYGYKNIENIVKGDIVKTEDGTYQKVISPTTRSFDGDFISLDFANSILPIESTNNHKFLTIKDKHWVGNSNVNVEKMEEIKKEFDFYSHEKIKNEKLAIQQRAKQRSSIIQPSWTKAENLKEGDFVLTPINYSVEDVEYLTFKNTSYRIDKDFLYVLGLFIGDGHFRKDSDYCIGFTLNNKDIKKVAFIKEYFSSKGLNVTTKTIEKNSRTNIIVYGKENTLFWKELFNNRFGAINKHIPNKLKNLPLEKSQYLLKGLAHSDGYFRKGERDEFVYASISYELVQDIKNILYKFSINPIITFSKGRLDRKGVNHKDSWYLSFSSNKANKFKSFCDGNISNFKLEDIDLSINDVPVFDGKTFFMKNRIKKINKTRKIEQVYCMQVENNHSFVLNGATVHNCLGSPLSQLILQYEKEGKPLEIKKKINSFIKFFVGLVGKDNFYLELQPAIKKDGSNKDTKEEQQIVNNMLLQLSKVYGLKPILTTDAHYLSKEQAFSHKVFLNASQGDREVDSFYSTTYLMDRNELLEYFEEDLLDTLIDNTHSIMNEIEDIDFQKETQVPDVEIPEYNDRDLFKDYLKEYKYINKYKNSSRDMDRYYLHLIGEGMIKYNQEFNDENLSRIDVELEQVWEISENMNQALSSYFVLTQDVVDMMWEVSLVGVARGSASCYYTNYLLGIVQINPLQHNLPFWR